MSARPDEPSDDALMQAYAAGDVAAFDSLFQRHRRALFTYLTHHTGNGPLAEDLFQEVFLRVIHRSAGYRSAGSFRAWLFAIAHNALTDDRRRSALRNAGREDRVTKSHEPQTGEPFEQVPASPADESDPVIASQAGEMRAHIEAALLRLPNPQREVFLLRERGGLDLAHIARVTGSNLATVKSRMRYALAGLRRLLSDQLASLPESFHE